MNDCPDLAASGYIAAGDWRETSPVEPPFLPPEWSGPLSGELPEYKDAGWEGCAVEVQARRGDGDWSRSAKVFLSRGEWAGRIMAAGLTH